MKMRRKDLDRKTPKQWNTSSAHTGKRWNRNQVGPFPSSFPNWLHQASNTAARVGSSQPWGHTASAPVAAVLKGKQLLWGTASQWLSSELHAEVPAWYLLAQVLLSPACLQNDIGNGRDSVPRGINCRIGACCEADKRDPEKPRSPNSIR